MRDRLFKYWVSGVTVAATALMAGMPAMAGWNPATGDELTEFLLPVMGGLLALSVVLVIIYAVLSAKKKK